MFRRARDDMFRRLFDEGCFPAPGSPHPPVQPSPYAMFWRMSDEGCFLDLGSLNPPVLPAPNDATSSLRRPGSPTRPVLLDTAAYIAADLKNDTYAEATTRTGQTVGVSFWLADPPAVSHLCIHCPGMKAIHFADEPLVVCSAKDTAVIRVAYAFGARPTETMEDWGMTDFDYFVYRSHAEKQPPSLRVVRLHYELHIFSSRTNEWTTKLVPLPEPPSGPEHKDNGKHPVHRTHKVITLDGGTLGWVDLGRGILHCNVLDSEPIVRYIELPKLLASNMYARLVRDITCSNGVIKLVEVEKRTTRLLVTTPPARPSKGKRNRAAMEAGTCTTESNAVDGWAAVAWSRKIGSGHWSRDGEAYFSGSSILAALRDNNRRRPESLALQKLVIAGPVWSVHGDDVFYLMGKADSKDTDAWAISCNLRKNTLEEVASFADERDFIFIRRAYHPFALSKYVPACEPR